jgi:hypothetical protein
MKNEKREIDFVSLLLLIGLILSYSILGVWMTSIIVTSHAPLDFKIIGELEWLVAYILFGVAIYYYLDAYGSI